MISQYYPSPKPKYRSQPVVLQRGSAWNAQSANDTTPVQTVIPSVQFGAQWAANEAEKMGITKEEWMRRNDIVVQLVRECTFRPGDTFYPCDKDEYTKYGKCAVVQRAQTYKDVCLDVWDKNENPYVITAKSFKPEYANKTILCTTAYLSKTAPI